MSETCFNIICISAKSINRKVIYSLLFEESFLQANSTNFQRKGSCIFIMKNINFYFNCSMHLHSIFRVISFRKEKRQTILSTQLKTSPTQMIFKDYACFQVTSAKKVITVVFKAKLNNFYYFMEKSCFSLEMVKFLYLKLLHQLQNQ